MLAVMAALSSDVRRRTLPVRVEMAGMRHSSIGEQVAMVIAAVMAGQLLLICSATRRATRRWLSFWAGSAVMAESGRTGRWGRLVVALGGGVGGSEPFGSHPRLARFDKVQVKYEMLRAHGSTGRRRARRRARTGTRARRLSFAAALTGRGWWGCWTSGRTARPVAALARGVGVPEARRARCRRRRARPAREPQDPPAGASARGVDRDPVPAIIDRDTFERVKHVTRDTGGFRAAPSRARGCCVDWSIADVM